jgi:hypothetical protein
MGCLLLQIKQLSGSPNRHTFNEFGPVQFSSAEVAGVAVVSPHVAPKGEAEAGEAVSSLSRPAAARRRVPGVKSTVELPILMELRDILLKARQDLLHA